MPLRLAEAQQLYDGLRDPLLRAALEAFFEQATGEAREDLLSAVLQPIRDTMKEARLAGRSKALEGCLREMEEFAKKALERAAE